jgi:hypothetical protein
MLTSYSNCEIRDCLSNNGRQSVTKSIINDYIIYETVNWIHPARVREPVAESCEHRSEPSGFTKDEDFLDQMSELFVSQEAVCSVEIIRKSTDCSGKNWGFRRTSLPTAVNYVTIRSK